MPPDFHFALVPAEKVVTDLEWLGELRAPAFDWTVDQLRSLSLEYFVAQNSGKTVAFIAFRRLTEACEILALATHPGMQERGLMQSLMGAFEDRLVQEIRNEAPSESRGDPPSVAKVSQTEVWLEVHRSNVKALKLYLKLGFQEKGRRSRYYQDGGDALVMTKTLPTHGKVG